MAATKGALATDPKSNKVTWTRTGAGAYKSSDGRTLTGQAKDPNSDPKYNGQKAKAANQAAAGAVDPQTQQYNDTMSKAGGVQNGLLEQAANRGEFNPQTMGISQFNPGDFQQQFQGAYDSALDQFNRSSQPAFDRQKQDFDQMAAERGIDPTSKQYAEMYKARISDPQETARLNAQDAAYQTGMGAQAQAYGQSANTYGQNLGAQGQQFGQASTQYQMPFANLNYLSPYFQAQYGQQMGAQQQGYNRENMAQQQKNALALQNNAPRGGGGGGGGLSLPDQMTLMDRQFYNNMVLGGLNGGQQPAPNMGNSALQGMANGIGAGIGAVLVK